MKKRDSEAIIILFSGPPGAGKTALARMMVERFKKCLFSISATTREKGPEEVHGKDYFFVTKDEFKKKIRKDEFVEYELVRISQNLENYYGTLKSEIERISSNGNVVIADTEIAGLLSYKKIFGKRCLTFYITATEKERESRMIKRGRGSEKEILERVKYGTTEQDLSKTGVTAAYIDVNLPNPDGEQEETFKKIEEYVNNFLGNVKISNGSEVINNF